MDCEWNDSQPIYRQIRDRVVAMILDGALKEGDPLPSVRNVAAEYRVNPLTVLKGYQELVDEGLVESRRGLGMFVNPGAYELLHQSERKRFLTEEWPRIRERIRQLSIWPQELFGANPFGPAEKDERKGEATPRSNETQTSETQTSETKPEEGDK
ncbi:MAG: GntR family transcriptional regulator [Candidatus Koribacter versatilis]|uniref:GntR family transcriptional regulator n=1 Tax=Candidatus Korobacter versatilis TaxID=658062 RepID=A0A932A946_9BACT|nr:GntR family transcriptional regulator [Candidatus Koribacter versatilis]